MTVGLELCVDSWQGVNAAAQAGAVRVELNSAIELGGLTPSIGLVEQAAGVCKDRGIELIAMVRPRPGGFMYDASELMLMCREIDRLLEAGVDGFALGVLTPEGTIDAEQCAELIAPVRSAGRQAVFHRAFDLTPEPIPALEALIDLGFDRVLTSGGRATAIEGAAVIRALIEHADGRIEVLPGGGVRPNNVAELVSATGCTQVHAALRRGMTDRSGDANPSMTFNIALPAGQDYSATDVQAVATMITALNAI